MPAPLTETISPPVRSRRLAPDQQGTICPHIDAGAQRGAHGPRQPPLSAEGGFVYLDDDRRPNEVFRVPADEFSAFALMIKTGVYHHLLPGQLAWCSS